MASSIDRGINYLDSIGAFNNPATNGQPDGIGLTTLALLEKRATGIPSDPPQGYAGANATDQGRMRRSVAYMISQIDNGTFYQSYRNGNYLMALTLYLRTGGLDRGAHADLSAALPYDLIGAINKMSDNLVSNQNASGYWYYNSPGSDDSSTTQFAVAGLASAKSVYSDPAYADPVRLAAINTALSKARNAYKTHSEQPANSNNTGSDNGACFVVDAQERGHGYNASGYRPTLQQTASGTWVQILGGADVNDSAVQNYLRWHRNHYRWQDLDNMGNFWSGNSYWYYLWSSFKGREFLRLANTPVAPGNLGPDDLGAIAPDATCSERQIHRDPLTLSRVALFGAGGPGFYSADPQNQYFDYAYSILSYQCADGQYGCNGAPGDWVNAGVRDAYALLVLQRATGGACVDTDGDGVCDDVDNCPTTVNPNQEDGDSDQVGNVCDNCPTTANRDQADSDQDGTGDACEIVVKDCDVDGDGDIDKADISLINKSLYQAASGPNDPRDPDNNGIINTKDAKICVGRIGK